MPAVPLATALGIYVILTFPSLVNSVDIAPHDHAQLRSVFALNGLPIVSPAPFVTSITASGSDSLSTSVVVVAAIAAFDTACFRIVGSIAGSNDAYLVTPKHWSSAMKSPFKREWLDGLFKHLNGCLQYGTYSLPMIPPSDVIVLPSVLAIRNKLDSFNRLAERKVRVCPDGSKQIQGLDYDESYAPAILLTTLRIQIALALCNARSSIMAYGCIECLSKHSCSSR
jgi:hypothetical protein